MTLRVADVMVRSLPLVSGDQSLRKAAEVMLSNQVLGVVVVDAERRPTYVLSYRRLVKVLAEGASVDDKVIDHAIGKPVTIREQDDVVEALEVMRKENVRFMPVVNNREELVGVLEPRHVAQILWDNIPYGVAKVEGVLRKIVVLGGDITLRVAAKAMDENGVPEIYVRESNDSLRVLREWDFLEAVARTNIDEARILDYARGNIIRVPNGFDAKAAVDLMAKNNVLRLLVEEDDKIRVVTLTDLAFEAVKYLSEVKPKTIGFIVAKVEPGKEVDLATDILMIPEVKEVYIVAGEYDLIARIEAPSTRELYSIVIEKLDVTQELRLQQL